VSQDVVTGCILAWDIRQQNIVTDSTGVDADMQGGMNGQSLDRTVKGAFFLTICILSNLGCIWT
jgi:hypothetical protein